MAGEAASMDLVGKNVLYKNSGRKQTGGDE